jgi:hypothetical protein
MSGMFDTYKSLADEALPQRSKLSMRTRGNSKIPIHECTEFTLHVSQRTEFAGSKGKLVDYSEHRLRRYIKTIDDKQQVMLLKAMLVDYLTGQIAVAWRRGQPVYVKVTKG